MSYFYLRSSLVHKGFLAGFSHSHCEQSLPSVSGHVQIYLLALHHEQSHPTCMRKTHVKQSANPRTNKIWRKKQTKKDKQTKKECSLPFQWPSKFFVTLDKPVSSSRRSLNMWGLHTDHSKTEKSAVNIITSGSQHHWIPWYFLVEWSEAVLVSLASSGPRGNHCRTQSTSYSYSAGLHWH